MDEIQKNDNDVVDFQYKIGTDTYESLQDRLQRLHKEGMEKFMKEKIFYVSDDYAEKLVQQYTGQTRKRMIDELKQTIRILKFYTNNDFAFKDVHNEELFLQNGKILVEVVQLFEKFRIIGSDDLQMLGDLFEQLLNKGFKQNEGQFFTPVPITRFIWDSLPVQKILQKDNELAFPKIIDYACGAGHFLTEGVEAVNDNMLMMAPDMHIDRSWAEKKVYGIEKDYRLARVSKISLFMHGAGDGNIIFGDGLENYTDKNVDSNSFDILVANPPYSVSAFKPHLNLKHNQLAILDKISNNGSEIETLFVERIAQLLNPLGVAAVILPSSILNKEMESFIAARESLLKNFFIRAIVQFGSKTFGATGTNTVVLFLQKFDEPPKRIDMVSDSVDAIFKNEQIETWEDNSIFEGYLEKIGVTKELYRDFVLMTKNYDEWNDEYFSKYKNAFLQSSEVTAKKKQKTFSKLTKNEQIKWYNKAFYSYVNAIEAEKLKYFGLVYKQKTLVVIAPDDNKGQEQFLGYKWSNRKGQEGIQIIKLGGELYKPDNRIANDVAAGLVRNSFADKQLDVAELSDKYYYLRTQDMVDFSGINFNKAIKTTKTRVLKQDKSLTTYYLSNADVFEIMIGDRVLSTDIVEDGDIPVYSANVHEEFGRINKKNIIDFSRPSVVWGIDGDWMVDYIPENKPFYPTDHCGVIRIKNDNILPKYLVYALQVEGEYERFSRANRASTQRIASLIIQVPELEKQKKIVAEMEAIDKQVKDEDNKLKKYDEDIKSEYIAAYFNSVEYRRIINSLVNGTNINNLKNEHIDELQIYIPSCDEQDCFVEFSNHIDKLRFDFRCIASKWPNKLRPNH
ncbi:N-6 DNA methylase [Phascolarctobacterium succinatutens]|uniref:N-6 DNA methylase n=1 Tax=Phascolarctobacterium succinatutens TaxID=626940 RepID=UPI0026ED9FEE|nr:N-6 DNA methylase [Phascolarctobacterium succinatutens]